MSLGLGVGAGRRTYVRVRTRLYYVQLSSDSGLLLQLLPLRRLT